MKLKKFAIFIFLFLLVCCANAVYATSDNNIMELDGFNNMCIKSGYRGFLYGGSLIMLNMRI